MYKYCILVFLLLLANMSFAGSLTWIEKRLSVNKPIEGKFLQKKNLAVLPRPIISQGVYQFKEGGSQLIWHTQTPINSRIVIDEQGISEWQAGKKTWLLKSSNAQFKTIEQLFSSLLQGNFSKLQEYFDITVITAKDELPWTLQLLPSDQALSHVVKKIELQGDKHIHQILMHEAEQASTLIELIP